MEENTKIELFLKLSFWLTDYPNLPKTIGEDYIKRLMDANGYKDNLEQLLEIVQESRDGNKFLEKLSGDQKNYCKGIAFLWYTSELINAQTLSGSVLSENRIGGTVEQYYSGLIWKVIRAHPPGLSGGYYGYWKYEPEN
ncbi:hypothetical protein HKT18_05030 [Flavobacterium sp. IMCC34852]|uniref:Gluconate 2-dehydrogenase subunit 3 family protein n=1 Tax=Flavobacterium rivulicola TaxID=2732161 RepID=A0A7Y3R817_9FLAO|nr:sugar dehydrogenase complex small subunit [Flavobacterium sp. IMCC34852]NNT71577.1 hypothetical protein [Flavobacterium sp. IMCC34852]